MVLEGTIEIIYDPANIYVIIIGKNLDFSVWSEIILLCRSGSEYLEEKSKWSFTLPWYEFRKILKPFAQYIKNNNINIIYDDISKKMLYEHIRDIDLLDSIIQGEQKKIDNVEKRLVTISFERKLTKEQLRDLSKLLTMGHGANFSVPGSGKTTTLLALHSLLKKDGKVTKLFVVGPRNSFISWDDEVQSCLGSNTPKIIRLTGGKDRISKQLYSDPKIALITYHQLPIVIDQVASFMQRNLVHIVLDESHRIKGGIPRVHYSAVIKLADLAKRRDIMSGTPMPQSSSDLEPQFDFLWPGSNILANALNINNEEKMIEIINKTIKPLYVRTTKKELGLSPPHFKISNIKLGPAQMDLYNLLRSETARLLSGMDKNDIRSFRKLGRHVVRLLQIASNPMLITANDEYPEVTSSIPPGIKKWELLTEFSKYEKPAKIDYTVKRVKKIARDGKKVVVWSVFVKNIELLENLLSDLKPVSIYGEIETGDENEAQTREWRIRQFHEDPNCMVLIGNPAACGEGISLHKVCHYAIYLDRTFNAAHYLQSLDRIHRLGLSPKTITQVELVQAYDTIDSVVDKRLKNKIKTMSAVLDDFDLKALAYDPEDIISDIEGGIDKSDIGELVKHLEEDS